MIRHSLTKSLFILLCFTKEHITLVALLQLYKNENSRSHCLKSDGLAGKIKYKIRVETNI